MFTPPIAKPKNNIFFNSDDSLYKSEIRKLTIPQIYVETAPVFKLEVTDFSEVSPKTTTIKPQNSVLMKQPNVEEDEEPIINVAHKKRPNDFVQSKSISLDVPDQAKKSLRDNDQLLTIGCGLGTTKKMLSKFSSSLQELSSSTSSINSGIHESTLDLTQIDPNTPIKHWKSPNEQRPKHFAFASKQNRMGSVSVPNLLNCTCNPIRNRCFSDESLEVNHRLTEFERMEVLKVLCDWSLQGCEANSDANFSLKIIKEFKNIEEKKSDTKNNLIKFKSETNLSSKPLRGILKCTSETNLGSKSFLHDCKFTNCIFNKNFQFSSGTNTTCFSETKEIKGILKNSNELLKKDISKPREPHFLDRRHSDINLSRSFNSQLIRCGSLERLSHKSDASNEKKKFPEAYIVRKSRPIEDKSPRFIVSHKSYPKTWRSCSDIKNKQRTVKKCCKNAKKSCPLLRKTIQYQGRRKSQSWAEFDRESLDFAARVAALKDIQLSNFDCKNNFKCVAQIFLH